MNDYLDELIDTSKNEPEFAEVWGPIDIMLQLVQARVKQGLTQEDVASRMGINRARVSEMEKDPSRVSVARFVAYAQAVRATLVVKAPKGKPAAIKPKRGRPIGAGSKDPRAKML
jgi:transcriptional regulator with XRE-family HTH domain